MKTNRNLWWIWLVIIAACIKIFSLFPDAVEKYYSTGIYPVIARLLRILFGWVPFSIGDIFYIITGFYLLYKLYSFFKKIFKKQVDTNYFFSCFSWIISAVLIVYIIFNALWGLNYNRRGVAYQMNLKVQPYSTEELSNVLQVIVDRLNNFDSVSRLTRDELKNKHLLFSLSEESYTNLGKQHSIFAYPSPSVKPSVFSYLGDYLGFTGYYNPFSGEAQVNTTVPIYVQPFTTCHEIGHQIGYAKENEANIAGYLSAKSSDNAAFRYSVYFDLYYYAARELYVRDSNLLKPFKAQLKPGVKKDFHDLNAFYRRYQNPFEPYIRKLYGNYLKANEQPQGLMSYNEVIAWLIAYYKKNGGGAI
jgi:uncharacterized protein DUF3810